MALSKQQATDELIAELNADLRARDPMQVMKRQMRLKVLDEIRNDLIEKRLADPERADTYVQLEEIVKDLERTSRVSS